MDVFDRAQELEMRQRDEAISRHRHRIAPLATLPDVETALDCFGCGNEIPAERRLAVPGAMLCVACQEKHESNQRRGL